MPVPQVNQASQEQLDHQELVFKDHEDFLGKKEMLDHVGLLVHQGLQLNLMHQFIFQDHVVHQGIMARKVNGVNVANADTWAREVFKDFLVFQVHQGNRDHQVHLVSLVMNQIMKLVNVWLLDHQVRRAHQEYREHQESPDKMGDR